MRANCTLYDLRPLCWHICSSLVAPQSYLNGSYCTPSPHPCPSNDVRMDIGPKSAHDPRLTSHQPVSSPALHDYRQVSDVPELVYGHISETFRTEQVRAPCLALWCRWTDLAARHLVPDRSLRTVLGVLLLDIALPSARTPGLPSVSALCAITEPVFPDS